MIRPATAADPAEAEAFLAAHPRRRVRRPDVHQPRRRRARQAAAAARGRSRRMPSGRYLPGSVLVVDITGLDIDEAGAIWADGDADRLAWPVAGSLARTPWQGADSATALLAMHELDGRACDLDPRAILQRVVDRFTADGLTPVVACELEFYLIDAARTADGGIAVAPGPDGRRAAHSQVYGIAELDAAGAFLRDLWAACDAMGMPAGAAIAEYAPGQFEMTLAHRDALAAADDAVRFKHAAKGVAAAHGRAATFMAKPFADRSGSGLHIHVSVDDAARAQHLRRRKPERHAGAAPRDRRASPRRSPTAWRSSRRTPTATAASAATAMPRSAPAGASTTAPSPSASPPARRRRGASNTACRGPTPTRISPSPRSSPGSTTG